VFFARILRYFSASVDEDLLSRNALLEAVITVQSDDQVSSSSLEQVLQEVTASAFTQLDSATYLSSLFRA